MGDAQAQEEVLRSVGAGVTFDAAAAAAGVSVASMDRWMRRGTFAARLRQAIGRSEVLHTTRIARAAASGDIRAAGALLERQQIERLRIDLEASMGRDDEQ